jgi:hypothetical protein
MFKKLLFISSLTLTMVLTVPVMATVTPSCDIGSNAGKSPAQIKKAAEKKAERKAKRQAKKAEQKAKRDLKQAERKAKRQAKRAEQKAKRDAKKAEQKAKRAVKQAERKAKREAKKAELKAKKSTCDRGSKGSGTKGSKGSGTKGSKGSGSKGSKGSGTKGSKGSGTKGSKGSGSKGSKGSGSKGSKGSGSKGSKGSGSKGSKGSGSKGSKGSGTKVDSCTDSLPPLKCGECDGKMTDLTLLYNGTTSVNVEVYAKNGELLFSDNVLPNGTIMVEGFDTKGTLGTIVHIYIDDVFTVSIHTSCTVPLSIGMVFAEFTVTEGASRNGGPLCSTTTNIPEPPVVVSKGSLCGLVYKTLNYDDVFDAFEAQNNTPIVEVSILTVNNDTLTVFTDNTGKYCALDLDVGTVEVTVDTSTLPLGSVFNSGINPNSVEILENMESDAGEYSYILTD